MEKIFEDIYKNNKWMSAESISGVGSSLKSTEEIRAYFKNMIKSNLIICDIPCGDMNWMKLLYNDFDGYIGIDIVKPIIADNTLKYGNNKCKFMWGNICDFDFKLIHCDIIFTRDCLVHFSKDNIIKALNNICISDAKYLIMTHFDGNRKFIDIKVGDWRPINFCLAPFYLPFPSNIINEKCEEGSGEYKDKCMGVWSIDDIRKSLQNIK